MIINTMKDEKRALGVKGGRKDFGRRENFNVLTIHLFKFV